MRTATAGLLPLVLLVSGCVVPYYQAKQNQVPPAAQVWAKLKVGMTEAEVTALLGEPGSKSRIWPENGDPELWEYGEWIWKPGKNAELPSPKAYAVFFDSGKVWKSREPYQGDLAYYFEDVSPCLRIGGDYLDREWHQKDGQRSPTLKPPVLIEPADKTLFKEFPRELRLRWAAAEGTPADAQFYVQTEVKWGKGDGTYVEWGEATEGFTCRTGKKSMDATHPGAQPGRWRVKAFDKTGESDWSEWWYFDFGR